MIYLDNRIGSGDLEIYFRQWHIPHQLTRLDYADVAFVGKGPDGVPFPVGIEIKKVGDVLNCITSGRFAGHQLPGLLEDYARVWLIVEGIYSADSDGLLVHRRGKKLVPIASGARRFMYRDLDHWLTTMEVKVGIKIRRTASRPETARVCADLFAWWTHKEWGEHRAHLAFDDPPPDHIALVRPNVVRRVAKELPGVGWTKSGAVAKKFPTVKAMCEATEENWMEIEGIGKTLAHKIVLALRGEGT